MNAFVGVAHDTLIECEAIHCTAKNLRPTITSLYWEHNGKIICDTLIVKAKVEARQNTLIQEFVAGRLVLKATSNTKLLCLTDRGLSWIELCDITKTTTVLTDRGAVRGAIHASYESEAVAISIDQKYSFVANGFIVKLT